jgi:hypothetical protein
MQNRSKKRWLNIQIILASIAVTITVSLWNAFAKGNRLDASPVTPPTPDPTFTFTYTPNPTATATAAVDPNAPVHLPQVHLLLGGKMYVPPLIVAVQPSGSQAGSSGSSSRGGAVTNNPAPAPAPVTSTSSSKPK